jgi:hypothetical protein
MKTLKFDHDASRTARALSWCLIYCANKHGTVNIDSENMQEKTANASIDFREFKKLYDASDKTENHKGFLHLIFYVGEFSQITIKARHESIELANDEKTFVECELINQLRKNEPLLLMVGWNL